MAGRSPNTRPVASATPKLNARIRQSGAVSKCGGREAGRQIRNQHARHGRRHPSAAMPPNNASSALSVSSCATSLPRLAPTARRMAISLRRVLPRAISSPATFETSHQQHQARQSTSAPPAAARTALPDSHGRARRASPRAVIARKRSRAYWLALANSCAPGPRMLRSLLEQRLHPGLGLRTLTPGFRRPKTFTQRERRSSSTFVPASSSTSSSTEPGCAGESRIDSLETLLADADHRERVVVHADGPPTTEGLAARRVCQ